MSRGHWALLLPALLVLGCSEGEQAKPVAAQAQAAEEAAPQEAPPTPSPQPSAAAQAPGTPQDYNPKPLEDDVALPLPCGGEMVFRHVYILARGTLDDREISLGYPFNEGDPGYQQSFISGS
ncbi:type VI secretion protein, partial [Ectopseudomonas hydrolytica]